MDICVILPCAGEGSRLGLPFPKELAPLSPGRVVIDSCLDMIYGARDSGPRILLLEDGKREQTAEYIRNKLPGIPLARVRQDVSARDMPEGIAMLGPWLGKINVVLLPDAVYEYDGDPLSQVATWAAVSGRCFGAVKAAPEKLAHLGALKILGDQVLAYEDKPPVPTFYDSAWVMLGFSSSRPGMNMLDFIRASTSRTHPSVITPEPPVPVVWLKGFRDCGTWNSYTAEFTECSSAPTR